MHIKEWDHFSLVPLELREGEWGHQQWSDHAEPC